MRLQSPGDNLQFVAEVSRHSVPFETLVPAEGEGTALPMSHPFNLDALATLAYDLLIRHQQVLVTAESCTAGLIAATLSRVPGMSQCLAGAQVVYQSASKTAWLDVPAELIDRHGDVSREVATAMATHALAKTPHATIAISITGHLGPDAPAELDGIAWLGCATRQNDSEAILLVLKSNLTTEDCRSSGAGAKESERSVIIRHARQQDAVIQALAILCDRLAEMG